MPKYKGEVNFTKPTLDRSVDPLDLNPESFQVLDNLEERDKIGELQQRKGLEVYTTSPTKLKGEVTEYCDIWNHTKCSFSVPEEDTISLSKQIQSHIALVYDDGQPASINLAYGDPGHRGRYVIGDLEKDHSWAELTTFAEMSLDGVTNAYSTQLGNTNLYQGYAVQGYPIAGHKAGYQAYPNAVFSEGNDVFGNHVMIGNGCWNPKTYPLMLQFINKPKEIGSDSYTKRNLGYFGDNKEFIGWYFSEAAPAPEIQAQSWNITGSQKTDTDVNTVPTLPPGTYIYDFCPVYDGVNEDEPFKSISLKIDKLGASSYAVNNTIHLQTTSGLTNNDNIVPGSGVSQLSVGSWDAFCKRLTSIRVYRRFVKGTWDEDSASYTVDNDNKYKDYYTHKPRLLADIDINSSWFKYGDNNYIAGKFVPNPKAYTVYEGSCEVRSLTTPRSVKLTDAIDGVLPSQDWDEDDAEVWPPGVYNNAYIVYDYDQNGEPVRILNRGTIDSTGLRSNYDLYVGHIPVGSTIGDRYSIRIGNGWFRDFDDDSYYLNVIDHRFSWAAGENTYVPKGSDRRPHYAGRTLIGPQAFVWDYWENRGDGVNPKRFRRSIRYAIPKDLGYPTVFYDGVIDLTGDDEADPIQAVIPVQVTLNTDSIRAVALVCGKRTSQIMTVENGNPIVQPQKYNFGLAGAKSFKVDGTSVYGLDPDGLFWKYELGVGFQTLGLNAQEYIRDKSGYELSRTSISLGYHENSLKYLWFEFSSFNNTGEGYGPSINQGDQLYPKNCSPTSDWWANAPNDGGSYCYTMASGLNPPDVYDFQDNITEASRFGFRYTIDRDTWSRRTSYNDGKIGDNLTGFESYQLDQALDNYDDPVFSAWAATIVNDAFVTKPCFMHISTTNYNDNVDVNGETNPERGYTCAVETKDYETSNGIVGALDYVKELRIAENSVGTLSYTATITDSDRGNTKTISNTTGSWIRKFLNFPVRLFKLAISYTGSNETTTDYFRLRKLQWFMQSRKRKK